MPGSLEWQAARGPGCYATEDRGQTQIWHQGCMGGGGGLAVTTMDHKSVGYRIPKEWDSMGPELRDAPTLAQFKRASKAPLGAGLWVAVRGGCDLKEGGCRTGVGELWMACCLFHVTHPPSQSSITMFYLFLLVYYQLSCVHQETIYGLFYIYLFNTVDQLMNC